MPKVSIIVPNFNYARFLRARLRSILDQSFQDFEIIYMDDACTDDSAAVFQEFAGNPKLRAFTNETNSGSPCKQWNKGVQLARGEFVWIAEADDLADRELLEVLVGRLQDQPRAGLAYCQSHRIDGDDAIVGSMISWTADLNPTRWLADFRNDGRDECARFLIHRNTVPNASAVVFRRDAYLRAGQAEEDMRLCGDWMTWVKILMISDVAFSAWPLNRFRCHAGSVRETTPEWKSFEERFAIKSYICRRTTVSANTRGQVAGETRRLFEHWLWACPATPPLSRVLRIVKRTWALDRTASQGMLRRYLRCRLARSRISLPLRAATRMMRRFHTHPQPPGNQS